MAKANKSEFLKGFGKLFEVIKVLVNAALDIGKEWVKRVATLIVGAKKATANLFHVFVDYTTPSYAELKTQFDLVNEWYEGAVFEAIDSCKAISRDPREIVFEVVHLDRNISIRDARFELDKRGLRPALYEELLGFAKAHPNEQRRFIIYALGSVCVGPLGRHCVPFLGEDSVGRCLYLHLYGHVLVTTYRFLAVSK